MRTTYQKTDWAEVSLAIKFYMVENCEFFKMGFEKILDLLHRVKTHSKALTRYNLYRISYGRESQNCYWVLFSVTRFLISRTPQPRVILGYFLAQKPGSFSRNSVKKSDKKLVSILHIYKWVYRSIRNSRNWK